MLTTRPPAPAAVSPEQLSPETAAVLQLGKLGDMTLTTPLFSALRRYYPDLKITVITFPNTAIIPETHPAVDEVLTIPRGFLRQLPTLTTMFRSRHFDLYIDIKDHRSTTSRMIAERLRADVKIAHASAIKGVPNAHPLPSALAPGHYVDKALAPMQLLAPGETFGRRPTLEIPIEAYRAVDDQLDPGEHGIIAVNISAGDRSRYWEPERWRETIAKLSAHYSVAVLSSPADRGLADEICTTRKRARPIRTENILEAAAVVDRALAVLTPDTSVVHLASALDRRCVGLYPPIEGNARTFAPLSRKHRVIMPPEGETFSAITVEQVVQALKEVLEGR